MIKERLLLTLSIHRTLLKYPQVDWTIRFDPSSCDFEANQPYVALSVRYNKSDN
jgi:hypothetical protein